MQGVRRALTPQPPLPCAGEGEYLLHRYPFPAQLVRERGRRRSAGGEGSLNHPPFTSFLTSSKRRVGRPCFSQRRWKRDLVSGSKPTR